jgi:iron complex transport system substrate-binding protein
VSLAASVTETLFAIGLEKNLVGVTDTCDYPAAAKEKPNVSCWFEPDIEKLAALRPDLVVGLKDAHSSLKPILAPMGIEVILLQPATVVDALSDILMLGNTLGAVERTKILLQDLDLRLAELDERTTKIAYEDRPTASRVLEAQTDRLIVAGPLSFQYDVILRAGGRNVTAHLNEAYPKVSFFDFKQWDPEVIFFCGYDKHFIPRLEKNPRWRTLKAIRNHRVYQFDCALTCRAGPRIVDMADLLFNTLYATH